ncbi:hypothetical protein AXG93_4773s1240 [Marchantia polymorpha subsp. ruderalis]|uniref:L-ascorbate peroxidase n=2 Tax=Marchantia polymorpha TaxID=3197 RepID=A0A176WKK7_MARPO|nr:hypothetical protein AXG93_4773s1240 [Marchantia polymorpha subsp. ruderalis]
MMMLLNLGGRWAAAARGPRRNRSRIYDVEGYDGGTWVGTEHRYPKPERLGDKRGPSSGGRVRVCLLPLSRKLVTMPAPVVDSAYRKNIEKLRRDLRAFIAEKNCAPLMVRLGWHDAGTYDAATRTGGANGSIRSEREFVHGANNGLKKAIDWCEEFKAKYPNLTYADIYQLGGVVGVEVTGGPTIEFIPGRKDSVACTPEGRLPDATKGHQHLRDIFHRMGLSDQDIVALSGAHTLGRAHKERSGFDGPWTSEPLKFDNSYFVELIKGGSEGLLMLATDKALMEDPKFRTYVEAYAKDEELFFHDYAISHKKLSELGCTAELYGSGSKSAQVDASTSTILAQAGVGVVVTAIVVVASYMYDMKRKVALK